MAVSLAAGILLGVVHLVLEMRADPLNQLPAADVAAAAPAHVER
jgi:hypothetical protein